MMMTSVGSIAGKTAGLSLLQARIRAVAALLLLPLAITFVLCGIISSPATAAEGTKVAGLFDFLFSDPNAAAPAPAAPAVVARHKRKRPKHRAVESSDTPERPERAERQERPVRERVVRAVAPSAPRVIQPPAAPKVTPTLFVDVMGDSLAVPLLEGLQEAFTEQPEVAFLRKAKEASGLARSDYYDWGKTAHDLLGGKEHVDVGVMILGSNDAQALHEGNATFETTTDKWKELYTARVAAIIKAFKDKKVPLIWVGLPIMKNARLSAQAAAINEVVRTEVTKAGATYVESWQGFADDAGNYQAFGPDANGQQVKLRGTDGIHFTRAGARKLALFVEPDLRRTLESNKPPVDAVAKTQEAEPPEVALPPQPTIDVNVLIQRELARVVGKPAGTDNKVVPAAPVVEARLPVPALPLEPMVPQKPAAGPVMPLTSAPRSPNANLVSLANPTALIEADKTPLSEQALQHGRPLEARPGRADDFHWPHP